MKFSFNKIKNLKKKLLLSPFPGDYSSPIVNAEVLQKRKQEIFSISGKNVPGINLNEEFQLTLLNEFEHYYSEVPFREQKNNARYYYDNGYYLHSDAIFLYLMIRHFHPKRIVEIGAGFSSAAMMDAVDSLGLQGTALTFIDPFPDRVQSLLREEDHARCKIIDKNLEDVEGTLFEELTENDILFIDSSHVCKTGSDVNKIIFEILPKLKSNVLVHFHDVFFPFEYPQSWVLDWNSFGWNEDYFLRAFLMYNNSFEIVFFNTFLEHFYRERFSEKMPDCLKNPGGSLWIRKK